VISNQPINELVVLHIYSNCEFEITFQIKNKVFQRMHFTFQIKNRVSEVMAIIIREYFKNVV